MADADGNLFAGLPRDLREERFEELRGDGNVRFERTISPSGTALPGVWYCQEEDEWVLVMQGEAAILFEGEAAPRVLKRGDYLFIGAGRRHRVEWTGPGEPTVWLAIHFAST